jgi:exopolysaccharide production protein ExoZ
MKIESLQLLRAAAAVGVILFHAASQLAFLTGSASAWSGLGAAGVDLFFVISGFIMWVTAVDRDESAQRFVMNRVLRIVPLYWFITALVLMITLVKPGLMRNASHDPAHFAASFAFIAWPHPALQGHFWPPVVPGWTLNYEALFYLVVAASLPLHKAWRGPLIAAVLVGLALGGILLHPGGLLAFYANPIVLEFLFGIAIGASRESLRPGPKLSAAVLSAGIVLFISAGRLATDENRALMWGLPLAVVVLAAVNIQLPRGSRVLRWLLVIGDASYSIYLTQFLVLPPAGLILWHVLGAANGMLRNGLFAAGLLAAAIGVGVATYYCFEKPILRASKDFRRSRHRPVRQGIGCRSRTSA